MSRWHEEHPDYAEMGVFAGYEEFVCDHISIVSCSDTECQCMDCLRKWPKKKDFKSDWPNHDIF